MNQLKNSFFSHLNPISISPVLAAVIKYQNDTFPNKIDLGVGAYRNQSGQPYIFNCVKKAQQLVLQTSNKEYPPMEGIKQFLTCSKRLTFGGQSSEDQINNIASIQTISGTGALSLGFKFLKKFMPNYVYVSNISWENHQQIVLDAGLDIRNYPYYDSITKKIPFEKTKQILMKSEKGSILLLQLCGHNPTGVDFNENEWKTIADIVKRRNLIPFFDSAYQGFTSGDLQKDAWPIRHFIENNLEILVAQSYSKNMGLYGERVGALHIVTRNFQQAINVQENLKVLTRKMYSFPPIHGALIAKTILENHEYFQQWQGQLKEVSGRIIKMRKLLREQLEKDSPQSVWRHITDQRGIFSLLGLSKQHYQFLFQKHHIYLDRDRGRISLAGINQNNYKYLAASIKQAMKQVP